jgi:AraC-like DNA-binding protein
MPASTLRHRLHQEGETYQAIKDEIRRGLAVDWLLHSGRGISDIAIDLGFTEPSAFHRAFRKWTMKSPGAFRREADPARHLANAPV